MNASSCAKSTAKANKDAKKVRQGQTKMPAQDYVKGKANLEAAVKSKVSSDAPSEYNIKKIFGDDNPKHPYKSDDDRPTSPKKKQDSPYVFFHGTQPVS